MVYEQLYHDTALQIQYVNTYFLGVILIQSDYQHSLSVFYGSEAFLILTIIIPPAFVGYKMIKTNKTNSISSKYTVIALSYNS